jgi:hypothetical protein
MKNLFLKVAILPPLFSLIILIAGIFIISYIEFVIMIFKVYAQIFK